MQLNDQARRRLSAAVLLVSLLAQPLQAAADPGSGYGWTKLDRRIRPFGASAPAMAFDEARGEMVLLPGYDDGFGPGGTWLRRDGEWGRVHPGIEPQPRYGAQMVYDAARREIVMFGGYGSNPDGGPALALNDTWTWDGQKWHEEQPAISPSRRALAAMVYDATRQEIVLFGGIGVDDNGQAYTTLGDTWTWDGTTWTRRQLLVSPPVRHGAGIAFDHALGETVLFGGSGPGTPNQCLARPMNICIDVDGEGGESGELNDTWIWDGQTWVERSTSNAPGVRSNMGMTYDRSRQRVVLFSGVEVGGLYWDTWTWDGTDWTEVTPEVQPGPRFSPAMVFDPQLDQVILHAGHRITYLASDTWGWNGTTWATLEEATPPERLDAAMATDPTSGRPVLFGGLGDEYMADTWTYDQGWHLQAPATSPPARFDASVATDTVRKEIVLFGGLATGDNLADTWTWDGTTWRDSTPELPSLSPPARRSATMAFDQASGEAVLFGGWNSDLDVMLSDTWTWDGSAWHLEVVAPGPPALQEHMMAYDAARDEVVLYGGIDEEGQVRGETWTWDGDGWTEEEPATSPGNRAGSVMVYDQSAERVLLLGGLGGEKPLKVWAWDGSVWSEVNIPPGPARAGWSSMAYAPSEGGALLYGAGEDATDETWLLRLPPA